MEFKHRLISNSEKGYISGTYKVCLFSFVVTAGFADPGIVWQLLPPYVHILVEPTAQTWHIYMQKIRCTLTI